MPYTKRVIYLHGFASSPQSRKAQFFAGKLLPEGFEVEIPDLAAGDFRHLTISGQLRLIDEMQGGKPAILIGSSLGGYLAALHAARRTQVEKVVLLAPAFNFFQLWNAELGAEKLRAWREKGSIPVFHYGEGRELPLAYDLMEDAAKFEAFPNFSQPGLIFHGLSDPIVPVGQSKEYAVARPNIRFLEMESGHELTDVLEQIWDSTRDFLLAG